MTNVYLTKERLAELKKELGDLKTIARREIAERLKQAKGIRRPLRKFRIH